MKISKKQSLVIWSLLVLVLLILLSSYFFGSSQLIWNALTVLLATMLAGYALSLSRANTRQLASLDNLRNSIGANIDIFSRFFNDSQLGFCAKDPSGRFLFGNKRFLELFELTSEELAGKSGSSIYPPEILEHDIQSDKELLEGKKSVLQELKFRNRDSEQTYILLEKHIITTGTGQPIIVCIFLELNQLSITQSRIRKLMAAVEESPISIIITDANGKIEYANKQFESLTGYTREEVLGRDPRIFKSGYHDREFYKDLWTTIKSGKTWHGELLNRKKDGTRFWEDSSIVPVKGGDGEIMNFVAVKEDVTALKKIIKESKEARLTAELAVKSRTKFLNNLADEFKSPISLVTSYAKILHNDQTKTEKQASIINDLLQKCYDFQSLLDNVTEVSRIYLDSIKLNPVEFDLEELAEQIMSVFSAKATKSNIKFTLKAQLPEGSLVRQDEKKIRLIISNLMDNAFRHTHGGKISLSLFSIPAQSNYPSTSDPRPGKVAIEVLDTGKGIEPDQQKAIFRNLEQIHSEDIYSPGAGLGLGISKRYAELMGGSLKLVWSKPEKGSLFKAEIPVEFMSASKREKGSKSNFGSWADSGEKVIHEPRPFDPDSVQRKFRERLYHAGLTGNISDLSKTIGEMNIENPDVEKHLLDWLKELKVENFVETFKPENFSIKK